MENLSKKEELIFLIKFIDKEFKKDFESRLSEYGLTSQQGRLLFYISCNTKSGKKVRQVDIENHFKLTKSTVHGLIDRMEKAKLVIKVKEGGNQYIAISDKTEGILTHVFDKRTECIDKMLQGISDEEVETLHRLLTKIYNNKDKGGDN